MSDLPAGNDRSTPPTGRRAADRSRRGADWPTVPGRLVCNAIEHEQFLVLTHPEPIRERIAQRGADPDAFVAAQIERLPTPPNLPPR